MCLSAWNWNCIGSLENNLKKVTHDITGLESKDAYTGLADNELDVLCSCYNLHTALLRQLSIKWQSKARMKWGDSNSVFFHKVTIAGRKRNKISYILTPLDSKMDIFNEFVNFYTHLWSASNHINCSNLHSLNLPQVNSNMHEMLTATISLEQIQNALRSMTNGKAPGPAVSVL